MILDAAIGAFAKQGYANVSMDQIAQLASVSKRTVYNHFESKDSLFEAIIDEMIRRADVLPEFPYQQGAPIKQQLRQIGLQICRAVSEPSFLSLARVVTGRAMTEPQFAEVLARETQKLDDQMIDWLRAAKKDKQFHAKSVELAAEFYLSMLLAHSFWPNLLHLKKNMHKRPLRSHVNQCVDVFLASF